MGFALLIGIFGAFVVLILGISVAITQDWFGRRVAQRQSVLIAASLTSVALIGGVLYLLVPFRWHAPLLIAGQLGAALVLWATLLVAVVRRRRAGAIVLDLGPIPGYQALRIAGGLLFLNVLLNLFTDVLLDHDASIQTWSLAVLRLAICSMCLYQGSSRVQLRTRGMLYQQFVPWNRVTQYGWEQDRPTTLTLQVQSWSPFAREHSLSIPTHDRDTVRSLLARYVGLHPTNE